MDVVDLVHVPGLGWHFDVLPRWIEHLDPDIDEEGDAEPEEGELAELEPGFVNIGFLASCQVSSIQAGEEGDDEGGHTEGEGGELRPGGRSSKGPGESEHRDRDQPHEDFFIGVHPRAAGVSVASSCNPDFRWHHGFFMP